MNDSYPQTLVLGLTNLCTTHCAMCYRRDTNLSPKFFPLDRYITLLDELPRLTTVEFSGIGEPTMHPQFKEFISYTRQHYPKIRMQLVTNGSLLTPDLTNFLIGARLSQLWISVNACTQYTRNKVMPNTDLNTIINAVKQVASHRWHKPTVMLSFVVTKDNYTEAEGFLNFGLDMKANDVMIRPVDPMLQPEVYVKQSISRDQFEAIYHRIALRSQNDKRISISPMWTFWDDGIDHHIKHCPLPHNTMGIYFSSGEVSFCCYMATQIESNSIGNIHEQSALSVWNGVKAQLYRSGSPLICQRCSNWWS